MRRQSLARLLLTAAFFGLGACGGGGGGGGGGLNSTPPAPPPPPPPGSGTAVDIFPSVTTSRQFASVGYEAPNSGPLQIIGDGFSVSYDAATDLYVFDLPSHAPKGFYQTSSNTQFWKGHLGSEWPPMQVLKPSATNQLIQLTHSSYAAYLQAGPMEDVPHGFVAFGSATPASAIPTNGSATFNAIAAGRTSGVETVGGTATLQFNFGAGTLTGQFEPILYSYYGDPTSLGTYGFVNTVYSAGSQNFSGALEKSGLTGLGSFNGLFTGPNAEEMIARWRAPYLAPGSSTQSEMFGVWVGKKQ